MPPAEIRLSWPRPNYTDPVTQGSALTVLTYLLTVLTVVIVSARLWARVILVKLPGLDDIFIILATVSTAMMRQI